MSKLDEMMARLIEEGLEADNPPVGFVGGAKLSILKGIRMRCNKVTLFARMDGDQLVDFEKLLPYGFLHVEAPELRENTIVAVRHQLDFFNAWVLKEKGLFDNEECEVHVQHRQASGFKKMLRGIFPQFEYMVFPVGLFADLQNPSVREFALEEKRTLRLCGHDREVNQDVDQ